MAEPIPKPRIETGPERPLPAPAPDPQRLSALLQLESEARCAESLKALQFTLANETRRLLPYRQALVFSAGDGPVARFRLEAAASVAVVERNAPFVRWVEGVVSEVGESRPARGVQRLEARSCPPALRDDWRAFAPPHVLWCPLVHPDGRVLGGLWLGRDRPWHEHDETLVRRVAGTFAHAWGALAPRRRLQRLRALTRPQLAGIVAGIALLFLLPVRLTTLAPVEAVAKDPFVVAAPMDGVIARVAVPPNTLVEAGQELFAYEDTHFRNQYAVAEKTLAVTRAELRTASQGAFHDAESNAQVALLQARAELSRAERDWAKDVLERVVVQAEQSGLLLYGEESDWIGRPVMVGERMMQIADPERVEFRIDLPVSDAIVLREGARAKIFLDVDPLADLSHPEERVRLGLQGTAKIYGERVTLFFYLFRRPIAAARQWLGL
jgi:hypothetical protein